MSEVKPKFAPKVQAVWESCGTYVDHPDPEAASEEIEYFVEVLIENICWELRRSDGSETTHEFLVNKGYINE